jgi:hypothetical protein
MGSDWGLKAGVGKRLGLRWSPSPSGTVVDARGEGRFKHWRMGSQMPTIGELKNDAMTRDTTMTWFWRARSQEVPTLATCTIHGNLRQKGSKTQIISKREVKWKQRPHSQTRKKVTLAEMFKMVLAASAKDAKEPSAWKNNNKNNTKELEPWEPGQLELGSGNQGGGNQQWDQELWEPGN